MQHSLTPSGSIWQCEHKPSWHRQAGTIACQQGQHLALHEAADDAAQHAQQDFTCLHSPLRGSHVQHILLPAGNQLWGPI